MNGRQRFRPEFGEHLQMVNDLAEQPVARFVAGIGIQPDEAFENFFSRELVGNRRGSAAGDGSYLHLFPFRFGELLFQEGFFGFPVCG